MLQHQSFETKTLANNLQIEIACLKKEVDNVQENNDYLPQETQNVSIPYGDQVKMYNKIYSKSLTITDRKVIIVNQVY